MANISKITLPDGNEYNIKDEFSRNKTIEYILGTQASSTNAWTGNTADAALYTGKVIAYKLPYAGNGSAVTLKLTLSDGTETAAIPVRLNNNTNVTTHFSVNSMLYMTYDGTVWRTQGEYWVNDNTVPSAYGYAAANNAAKVATCTYYTLTANTYLHFDMRYENTVAGAITMNVNSTGAKPIYINGEASSATNYTLPAGSYIAFYDGTAWHFRTDGKLPGIGIIGDAGTVNGHTVLIDVPADAKFTDTTYTASSATPLMDGTGSAGSNAQYARGDHRHPTDTTRAPLASPGLTGTPTAPTANAGTNTTQIATTAFVKTAVDDAVGATLSITIPATAWSQRTATVTCQGVTTTSNILVTSDPSTMEPATASGVYCSAQGTDTLTFTCMGEEPEVDLLMDIWIGRFLVDSASYAPISSPTFTGTPTAPTANAGTSNSQIATTAFVMEAVGSSGVTPSSADPLMDGTASPGSNAAYARGDHVHPTDTSRAAASHSHGNITNAGAITATGVAIANNDTLAIVDASDSSKIKKTSIKFDGSTTTKALTQKGTFETFLTSHQSLADYAPLNSPAFTGTPTAPTAVAGTNTTQLATTEFVTTAVANKAVPEATTTTPKMDGTAAVGTETKWAKGDHVHPTDTSRAPLASPALTGTPTAPTASNGTNTTQIATTAFVTAAVANKSVPVATTTTPKMDGTAAVGSETKWAKGDHVHPTDTSRAPLASPSLTGTPTAPTANAGTNTTQIATTAFVKTAVDDAVGATLSVTIPATAWSQRTATVTVQGVTTTSNILVTSDPSTMEPATASGVYCSAQGTNSLTFTCMGEEPEVDLLMDIWIGRFLVDSASYAPISSPTFTGTPTAPTANAGTSNSQIATTAFVMEAVGSSGLTPSSSDPLMDGTASPGTSTTYSRGDHRHPTDTSRASSTHTHGNITNAGAITATGVAIANNDALVIVDASDSSKLKQTSVKFDGTTATKALTQKGTFETFLTSHQSLADYAPLNSPAFTGTPTAPTAVAGTSTSQIATTEFVSNAITAIAGAMYFMGSLGTGGTITTLPAASAANKGYAYKVITAGTYQGVTAKVGDLLVSDGTAWVLIPSGDEPSGTVTSITIKAGTGISLNSESAITTSGTRTITNTGVLGVSTGSNSGTISVNTNGSNAEVAVAGLGSAAYTNAGDYLKLTGGTMSGGITMPSGSSAFNDNGILFSNGGRIGTNTSGGLGIYGASSVYIRPGASTASGSDGIEISTSGVAPSNNGTENLGDSSHQWNNIYAVKYTGNAALSGAPTAPTAAAGTNTTQIATTAFVTTAVANKSVPVATTTTPKMDGTAAVGSETKWAKGDHVHPTDTTRAPLASPGLTGTPTAPTANAGTNTTQIATTAFVKTAVDDAVGATLSITIPATAWSDRTATVTCQGVTTTSNILVTSDPSTMEPATASGVYCSAQGTNTLTFTCMGEEPEVDLLMDIWIGRFLVDSASYAPISSPTFTGIPTAPTANAGTDNSQIATTAFVMSAIGSSGLTPSSTDPLMDGTASPGTSLTYSRGDHKHPTDTSRASSTHTHGNITNAGAITASGVALANNDALVITDASDSSKIKKTSIVFDGSTATKALTQKGTFETFLTSHQSLAAYAPLNSPAFTGIPTAPTAVDGDNSTQIATTAYVDNHDVPFNKVVPIQSKQFTNVIGTANNWADATFFFGKIVPTSWDAVWSVKYKMTAVAAGVDYCKSKNDCTVAGFKDTFASYSNYNEIANSSYIPVYYTVLYRLKQAGYTNGYGHALGVRLYSGWNATTAANARTIDIEIIECVNCTFTFFDSMTKYASIPGTGSTNYNTYTEMNTCTQGLQETGDNNTTTVLLDNYFYALAGTNKIYPYTLIMEKPDATWESVVLSNSTAVSGKSANPSGFLVDSLRLYWNSGTTINAGSRTAAGTIYESNDGAMDYRYSFNGLSTTAASSVLTAYKDMFLVGTIVDGLFYLDQTEWLALAFPSTEDGKVYIRFGESYDCYRGTFNGIKPIYEYRDGTVRLWSDSPKVYPSSATPLMDGTAAVGTSADYARGDHRHPTDTSRAPLASPALTGTPTSPTATYGTNTTQIATTAFVNSASKSASIEYILGTQASSTNAWTGTTVDAALYTGKTIAYKLPQAPTSSAATLNLTLSGGTTTGAISIKLNNDSNVTNHFPVNSLIIMVYDGTVWRCSTQYWSYSNTVPSAYCETAAGTAAKAASCTNYSLTPNTYLHVDMRYANTYAGAMTFAANSVAGKPIYINGSPSSSTNYTLPAGTYIAFYDGTNWYFRTDGILPTGGVNVSNKANMVYNSTLETLDFVFA